MCVCLVLMMMFSGINVISDRSKAETAPSLFFQNDFEKVTTGQYPSANGWFNVYSGDSASVTNEKAFNGTKSFKLIGRPNWSRQDAVTIPLASRVIYEVSVCKSENNSDSAFVSLFKDDPNDWGDHNAQVNFGRDGHMRAGGDSNCTVELGSYIANVWYQIRVDADFNSKIMNVYINGSLVCDSAPTGEKYYETLSLTDGNSDSGTPTYFDDVKIWIAGGDVTPPPTKGFTPDVNGFSFYNNRFQDFNYPDHPFNRADCNFLTFAEVVYKIETDPVWITLCMNAPYFKNLLYTWAFLTVYWAHDGHCYGMTKLAVQYYEHPDEIPDNSTVYALKAKDVDSLGRTVYERVDYYQQSQLLDAYTFIKLKLMTFNLTRNEGELQKVISKGFPTLVGLWSPIGMHAVVATNYDDKNKTLDIYNPNIPGEKSSIEFNADKSFKYQFSYIDKQGELSTSAFTRMCALSYTDEDIISSYLNLLSNIVFVYADCPVELSVLDQNGWNVGESLTDGSMHLVAISYPSNGDYTINLHGTANGMYNISVARDVNNKLVCQNRTGSISNGQYINYKLSVKANGIDLTSPKTANPASKSFIPFSDFGTILVFVLVVTIISSMKRKKEDCIHRNTTVIDLSRTLAESRF